jgi:hypothetical protein
MAVKNPGLGTVLQLKISMTYTPVSQRVSLDGPELAVGTANTTDLDGTVETYRPTIPDSGELSGTLYYDPQEASTTHSTMFTAITAPSQTLNLWKLIFTDSVASTLSFSGILTKFKPTGMTKDGNLSADFTIKVSGSPVMTHT